MSDVFQGQNAEILQATIDGTPYSEQPESYIAQLLLELKAAIEAGGGGGTTNYNSLTNKPSINDVTLSSNKSSSDLGLQAKLTFDDTPTANSNNPVTSGGIKTAIDTVDDKLFSSIAGRTQNDKGSMELYSVDLNTVITSGFYNAMTCSNAPFTYCALIVCGYYLDGYCFQLAADINTGAVKSRVEYGGTWGEWTDL